jgi:simple sugar transport system permease protein
VSAVTSRLQTLRRPQAVDRKPSRWVAWIRPVALYLISIAVALFLVAMLVLAAGHSPWSVFNAIYTGSVSSAGTIGQTLDASVPVLLVALGTLIAVRAGMFNIGQTGQLIVGAMAAAFITLKWHGPGPLVLLVALVCALLGGAVWAGISAMLRIWRNIDVVISTLLLTYVAIQILAYMVSNQSLLQEPTPPGGEAGGLPQSAILPGNVRLPHPGHYPSFGLSSGLFIALGALLIFGVLLSRSRWGMRLRMVGANSIASRRFGVRVAAMAGGALIISGAFAGLAGGVLLTGSVFQIQPGFDNNFGNDGLLAALVCRGQVWALLPVSIVFAIIRTGGNYLLSTGVPNYLGQVLEGLLVLAIVFPPVYLERREWASRFRAARAAVLRPEGGPLTKELQTQ